MVRRPFTEVTAGTGGHDMRISCRHCGEPYDIDERSLPRFGASVRCPACGGLFDLPARSSEATRRAVRRPDVAGAGSFTPAPLPLRPIVPGAAGTGPADDVPEVEDVPEGFPVDIGAPSDGTGTQAVRSALGAEPEDAPGAEADGAVPDVTEVVTGGVPGAEACLAGADQAESAPEEAAAESGETPQPAEPPDTGTVARRIVAALAERHAATLDRAIERGALLSALGLEIAGAWEEFLAEAGERAREGRHFQDALNECFFGGRPVF